jgi:hypothetical protein
MQTDQIRTETDDEETENLNFLVLAGHWHVTLLTSYFDVVDRGTARNIRFRDRHSDPTVGGGGYCRPGPTRNTARFAAHCAMGLAVPGAIFFLQTTI